MRKKYDTLGGKWYFGKKSMVLWTKLWYHIENNGTSIYERRKTGKLPKSMKHWFIMENNYGDTPKQLKF